VEPVVTARNRRSTPAPSRNGDATDRIRRLEAEVAGLRRGMRTRGLIEQAKGRLAERLGLDAEAAFQYLSNRSQETNVAVIDLAAELMGAQSDVDGVLDRRTVRLRAGLDAAAGTDDLVQALADDDVTGAVAVALFAVEADGALRLLAAHGWPAGLASDWRWVPSAVRTPAGEAARHAEPLWLTDAGGWTLIGPGRARAALPVMTDGAVIAVLELAWSDQARFDPPTRQRLLSLAQAAGGWLASATTEAPTLHSGADPRWAEAVVEAMVTPAAVLTPLWSDDGAIQDFSIDWANRRAVVAWASAASPVGRRLLDVDPDRLHDGTFDTYVRAFDGEPPPAGPIGAARVGTRLIAAWPAPTGYDKAHDVRLSMMEELGQLGWSEWSRTLRPLFFSPGLYRLLGLSPDRGPLELDRLLAEVAPEDRTLLKSTMDTVAREQRQATADVVLYRGDGQPRTVRIVAVPRIDHRDQTRAVLALFQDRTEYRQAERAADRLAAQRVQAAVERAQTERLRAAFFPPPWTRRRYGPLTVIGRHAAPSGIQTFRGDFYQVSQLDGRLMIAVGDIFGSGVAAAHTMVRLRHTAAAFALDGRGPAEVLSLVNRELWSDEQPPLASLVLASIAADEHTVSWAQAGHYSPILVRDGKARSVRRPRGDLLGLGADTRYTQGSVTLGPGDLLVFFTDGVFQQWAAHAAPVRRLAEACERAQHEGGAESLVATVLPPADDEACLVAVEWPDVSR
jgi:PAS domain-containing protein